MGTYLANAHYFRIISLEALGICVKKKNFPQDFFYALEIFIVLDINGHIMGFGPWKFGTLGFSIL